MTRVTGVISVTAVALLLTLTTGCAPQGGAGTGEQTSSPSATTGATPSDAASPAMTPTEPPPPPLPTPEPDESVIFVTYGAEAGSVYASGIVPDRVDESGTCTLSARSGGDTRTGELEAGPTPTTMNCGEISISVPAGDWDLSLTYTSGSYTGHSGKVTVTVP